MDKFVNFCSDPKKNEEFSEYVHLNVRVIMVKMVSEMRRKLDIEPSATNESGYMSLMVSVYGRMFNEMIYALAGVCRGQKIKFWDLIPVATRQILLDLMQGKDVDFEILVNNVLSKEKFEEYYLKEIDALRAEVEALPKWNL